MWGVALAMTQRYRPEIFRRLSSAFWFRSVLPAWL